MSLTVVILTKNEARHIVRAIDSVRSIASRTVVIDSGSTDDTVALSEAAGAKVLSHPFVTQAQQFNWALGELDRDTDWVLRLDADEVVTPELANEIGRRLDVLPADVHAVSLNRRIVFLGRPIRWGGVFPVLIVRLFRFGHARSEDRWMDEHIVADGRVAADFSGEIHDHNLNPVGWWIDKHNAYASREVIEILDAEHGFLDRGGSRTRLSGGSARTKRWIKEHVYARLPGGLRAFVYFLYRYVVRLGFLDGYEGTAFHVLQGFWYRYLVDVKLREVRKHMAETGDDPTVAIHKILGIDVTLAQAPAIPSNSIGWQSPLVP